jgi:hypothetical protein
MSNERHKYRVWDVRKETYLNTDNVFIDASGVCYHFDTMCERFDLMQYDVIVEQCTGLTDKNGNLIFEGDVLEFDGMQMWVSFNNGSFVYNYKHGSYRLRQDMANDSVIIGNIHEEQFREITKKVEDDKCE